MAEPAVNQLGSRLVKRDERILKAAEDLFYLRGFNAVGVDEIGTRAGATGPAIYRHFASKDEILVTLFDRAIDTLYGRLEDGLSDPREELAHLVRVHVTTMLENYKLVSIWAREDRGLPRERRQRHHRRSRQYVQRWVDCLGRVYPERAEGELVVATYTILGMINSIGSWKRQADSVAGVENLLAEMALRGLDASLTSTGSARREVVSSPRR